MSHSIPPITMSIIVVNVIFFGVKSLLGTMNIDLDVILGAFYPQSPNFHLYQVLTHMFMHGGVMHLVFNMYGVYMFGSMLEHSLGQKKYLILYFLSGLGAFILFNTVSFFEVKGYLDQFNFEKINVSNVGQYAQISYKGNSGLQVQNNFYEWFNTLSISKNNLTEGELESFFDLLTMPMVGASGCVFGLLAAFAVMYPNERLMLLFLPFPIKSKYFVLIYFLVELYLGVNDATGDNVAHFAHVGGAIVGYILAKRWLKTRFLNN